ncbi:MAG: hypothetical protein ACE5JU_09820 [Candidatus Binatia bacterium]
MVLLTGAGAVLAACATLDKAPEAYLSKYNVTNPQPVQFPACYSFGCSDSKMVRLTDQEWAEVRTIFDPRPTDAEAERARVAKAVALIETIVGPQANTSGDRGRNASGSNGSHQLDCIAETVNTTTFLFMMQEDDLITWHRLRYPQHRGLLDFLWPHNTAVLVEKTTGSAFAVDSWFFDNGQPPAIVPLDVWKKGYQPEDLNKK